MIETSARRGHLLASLIFGTDISFWLVAGIAGMPSWCSAGCRLAFGPRLLPSLAWRRTPPDKLVVGQSVSVDGAAWCDLLPHHRSEGPPASVRNDLRSHSAGLVRAAPFKDAHNRSLSSRPTLGDLPCTCRRMHVAGHSKARSCWDLPTVHHLVNPRVYDRVCHIVSHGACPRVYAGHRAKAKRPSTGPAHTRRSSCL